MSNKKTLISDCSEYACKWIQKISQHSEDCEDEKYTLERLNAIKVCVEFEINLLREKGLKSFLNKVGKSNPGLFTTNHKEPLLIKKKPLDRNITQ